MQKYMEEASGSFTGILLNGILIISVSDSFLPNERQLILTRDKRFCTFGVSLLQCSSHVRLKFVLQKLFKKYSADSRVNIF